MIDTLVFNVSLKQKQINLVKFFLKKRIVIDNYSGSIDYEFTSGDLLGSFDYRIRIAVKNKVCIAGKWENVKEYLEFEFSLSKWSTGLNLTNCNIVMDAVRISMFRRWFNIEVGVMLPNMNKWTLRRLDIAYNIDCGHINNAKMMIACYKKLRYPRRDTDISVLKEVKEYKTSVYFVGTTTTFKIYMKYSEFKAHDLKRIKRIVKSSGQPVEKQKEIIDEFIGMSSGILRFEIEFKREKLKTMGCNNVAELFDFDWEEIMKNEYQKFQKGAIIAKIYKSADVLQKLVDCYQPGQGISPDAVFTVWNILSNFPDKKNTVNRMKRKRAEDVLKRLGIACISTIVEREVPDEIMMGTMFFPFFKPQDEIRDSNIDRRIAQLLPTPVSRKTNDTNRAQFEHFFPVMYSDYSDVGVDDGRRSNISSSRAA